MRPPNKRSSGGFELLARVSALLGALSRYLPGHLNHPSPLDPFPQPVHPSSRRQIVPSLRKSTEKKTSLLADTQETAEGTSTTVFQPRGRGLSVYPPSGHGRAMDDPNTPMIAVSAPLAPEVHHVAAEPRRHQLELRQSTAQIQGEGDSWQLRDLQAGVLEGFNISRNRQQSNYLRVRQEGASVPLPDCYFSDTDDDASMANDEGNDNFSERFFDVDCENYNGPRSLKTISKRSFSTWSFRSTRSTSSTDGGTTSVPLPRKRSHTDTGLPHVQQHTPANVIANDRTHCPTCEHV